MGSHLGNTPGSYFRVTPQGPLGQTQDVWDAGPENMKREPAVGGRAPALRKGIEIAL